MHKSTAARQRAVVAGPSSTLVRSGQAKVARPGILGRILSKFLSALLASGRANVLWLPESFNQHQALTEQEREWLELNLRYDFHM
jgi:hypothetical protein